MELSKVNVSVSRVNIIAEISNERQRQVDAENWTTEHDDKYEKGELALAAAAYAMSGSHPAEIHAKNVLAGTRPPMAWPWEKEWWKPSTPRRDLIKAAALIIAEIERLDREEAK